MSFWQGSKIIVKIAKLAWYICMFLLLITCTSISLCPKQFWKPLLPCSISLIPPFNYCHGVRVGKSALNLAATIYIQGEKKKKKRCNLSQNHHLLYKTISFIKCQYPQMASNCHIYFVDSVPKLQFKSLTGIFQCVKNNIKTKTHVFLTSYNHSVYEFASQTNMFYLDGQFLKNILQNSHKSKILSLFTNIFGLIFFSYF